MEIYKITNNCEQFSPKYIIYIPTTVWMTKHFYNFGTKGTLRGNGKVPFEEFIKTGCKEVVKVYPVTDDRLFNAVYPTSTEGSVVDINLVFLWNPGISISAFDKEFVSQLAIKPENLQDCISGNIVNINNLHLSEVKIDLVYSDLSNNFIDWNQDDNTKHKLWSLFKLMSVGSSKRKYIEFLYI